MLSLGIIVVALPWMARAEDQTSVTDQLNNMIATSGDGQVYTGGKGVVVRNPFDDYQDDTTKSVVPATFWVNDIVVPSQIYPDIEWGEQPKEAAYRASVAFVIGNHLGELLRDIDNVQSDDWGYGVFYATDSNAADSRCRYMEEDWGWDCPLAWINRDNGLAMDKDDPSGTVHYGTGWYAWGNPYAEGGGGGTGPHFEKRGCDGSGGLCGMDQENAFDANGVGLAEDYDSQCNYALNGNYWADWVDHWLANQPGMASVDQVGCWVNNIRDLIMMQNQMFWRYAWSVIPGTPPVEYWGWNEIPFDRNTLGNTDLWDAVMIHLPAEICGPGGDNDYADCLAPDAQVKLETTLQKWVDAGYLIPGMENVANRPGSYVVFAREFWDDDGTDHGNWFRFFFCNYWKSPNGIFEIVSYAWGGDDGACVIQWAGSAGANTLSTAAFSGISTDNGTAMLV